MTERRGWFVGFTGKRSTSTELSDGLVKQQLAKSWKRIIITVFEIKCFNLKTLSSASLWTLSSGKCAKISTSLTTFPEMVSHRDVSHRFWSLQKRCGLTVFSFCCRHETTHYQTKSVLLLTFYLELQRPAPYLQVCDFIRCLSSVFGGRQESCWSSVDVAGRPFPVPLMSCCVLAACVTCGGEGSVDLKRISVAASQINTGAESKTWPLCWEAWRGKYGIIPSLCCLVLQWQAALHNYPAVIYWCLLHRRLSLRSVYVIF